MWIDAGFFKQSQNRRRANIQRRVTFRTPGRPTVNAGRQANDCQAYGATAPSGRRCREQTGIQQPSE